MSELLHRQIDELLPDVKQSPTRMIVHALVDLGIVTSLACAYLACPVPDRLFISGGPRRSCITIDPIIPRNAGGSDRPENLQLMHFACNSMKGAASTPVTRQRRSDATKRRWADPAYRELMCESSRSVSPAARASRQEAMKRHWADPEKRAAHTAALARGEAWRTARSC